MDIQVTSEEDELGGLPIVDPQGVTKWVHIRLHHKSTLNDVRTFIKQRFQKYLISVEKENTPEQHFHILVEWENKLDKIGEYLRQYDNTIKGNKCFSASWMRSTNVFAYVVKDKKFCDGGFTNEEIKSFLKVSYKKYDREEFAKQLNQLVDEYLLNDKAVITSFISKMICLKIDYKQIIDRSYIEKYATMVECRKRKSLIDDISLRISDKIFDVDREKDFRGRNF